MMKFLRGLMQFIACNFTSTKRVFFPRKLSDEEKYTNAFYYMMNKIIVGKMENLSAQLWSHCKKTLHGVKSFCHKTPKEGGNVMQKKNLVSKFGGTIKKNLNRVKSFFNKQKEKTLSKICDNLKKANFNQGFFDQIGTQDKVVHIQSKSDSFHYVPKFLMAVFAIPKRVFFCYNDFLIRKNKKKKKKFFF